MFRNYLTVGLRALAKNKTYAFINIFGLAIGMAACLLILLFVRYETSYDTWLGEGDRAYQLQSFYKADGRGQPELSLQNAAYIAGATLKKDFPQIEEIVYVGGAGPVMLRNGRATTSDDFFFVDGSLFDVLKVPFVHGDSRTALTQPGSLVVTEKEASRLFGTANPMGQTLTLVDRGKTTDYHVTGVIKDLPRNTHLSLGVLARYDPNSYWADLPDFLTSWGWQAGYYYVRLRPGASAEEINRQLPAWAKRNIPDDIVDGVRTNRAEGESWKLVNVRDVHLGKAQSGAMTPGNDRRSLVTFGIIAILVLGMACVNFTNLATARASQRAREVALRKVLGAQRKQLILQFLGESVMVAGLAMLLALALTELLLPLLNHFLDAQLTLHYIGHDGILLPALALVLVVGVAGGIYPAFVLSHFPPAKVLRANKSAADARGSGILRNILVVGQFAVSIGLIACTIIIYAQTVYARTSDPGYKRDGLIQVSSVNRRTVMPVLNTLLHELSRVPGVVSMGRSTIGVGTRNSSNMGAKGPGQTEAQTIGTYRVDTGFFRTMEIPLLAGRTFVEGRAMDDTTLEGFPPKEADLAALTRRGFNVVVNELATKRLGFRSPAEAIGKVVRAETGSDASDSATPVTIIGVVKDSRFRSIRDPLEPIMFQYDRISPDNLIVRYANVDPNVVRERLEHRWKQIVPDVPFEATFSDDIVRRLYRAEQARAGMFAAFSGLAVVVGCLGLFGLAAFTAERRTKEIGIRKVLGARTRDIVRLLIWQFSRPVLIANLIAWPVAWWVMRDWLNGFDARIALNPLPFLFAGGLALAIAIATIASHAFRVARANPILALRYE
ncbi:ABC transporter permease [Sphingomonas sp. ASY06-1R]|uniref:ABC transporter permease n=1 Tax=Sphingomonas sp. ASY06-1R TaxID=3445771 RepID=UPI003FA1DB63